MGLEVAVSVGEEVMVFVAVRVAVKVGVEVLEAVGVKVGVEVLLKVGVWVDVWLGVKVGVKVGVGGWGMIWMASTMALVSALAVPSNWMVMAPPLGATLLMISSNAVLAPTWA